MQHIFAQRSYLVGFWEGAHRMQITTRSIYAEAFQKAGMIQAHCQSSLKGSVALKYNCIDTVTIYIKFFIDDTIELLKILYP